MGGPGFVPTFLFYFVGTACITAFVLTQGLDPNQTEINPFQVDLVLGVLAGLVGAYFNSHRTLTLPVKNRGAFLKRLKEAVSQLGFEQTGELDEFTVYERPAPSNFFSGKLFVSLDKSEATISGRSSIIRAVEKRLTA